MAAYNLIATTTVGSGGAASIDFTGIPQTYTDLLVVCSLRGNRADVNSEIIVRFNGSTTSFSNRILYGTGASASSASNQAWDMLPTGNSNTASVFGSASIYVPNYAGSTYKSFSIDSVNESNATTAYQVLTAGLWSNTAAITTVTLGVNTSNTTLINQYSSASLYGIKNS